MLAGCLRLFALRVSTLVPISFYPLFLQLFNGHRHVLVLFHSLLVGDRDPDHGRLRRRVSDYHLWARVHFLRALPRVGDRRRADWTLFASALSKVREEEEDAHG